MVGRLIALGIHWVATRGKALLALAKSRVCELFLMNLKTNLQLEDLPKKY